MKLSCALVTNVDSAELIAEAERLGYHRAWLYDSPAITSDVWIALALAAERTSTIGLGPGVLVPSLRHPMTNAAAIATLAAIAPGRVAVAIGSGFTGRYTLGKRPLRWAVVEEYVTALRALLRGETVQWEDAPIRMLHTEGFVADRPVDVEVLIGADGPKGTAVAERVGDGVFAAGVPESGGGGAALLAASVRHRARRRRRPAQRSVSWNEPGMAWLWCSTPCTNATAPTRCAACRAATNGWRRSRPSRPPNATSSPTKGISCGSRRWTRRPSRWRPTCFRSSRSAGPRSSCRPAVAEYEAGGVTELVYQPAGPDIADELARMMAAVGEVAS